MRALPLLLTSLLLIAAVPPQTGDLVLPRGARAQALPATAIRAGRVGGVPSIYIEVRMDGIAVQGEPVQVLTAGVAPPSPDDEVVLRAVYERLVSKVGLRRLRGVTGPLLGVLAVDGRVPAATLERVLESARFAGVERLLFLVEDPFAREPWAPERLPAGAPVLEDPRYDVIVIVGREGFEIVESDGTLSPAALGGLDCGGPCASVADMPWEALERVVEALADGREQPVAVNVITREADLPSAALIGAIGRARARFEVVSVDVVPATEAGGLPLGDPITAAPVRLAGKLVGVSAVLPHPAADEKVAGIPTFELQQALSKVAGRTRACVAQAGPEAEVVVRFEIDEDGWVQAATVMSSSSDQLGPGRCVLREVREVRFPKPVGPVPFVTTWTFDAGR